LSLQRRGRVGVGLSAALWGRQAELFGDVNGGFKPRIKE